MFFVYIGFGSNIGRDCDKVNRILQAIKELIKSGLVLVYCSDIIKTPPIGKTEIYDFGNCVALFCSKYNADSLLKIIQNIEKSIGRECISKRQVHGPREIELIRTSFL